MGEHRTTKGRLININGAPKQTPLSGLTQETLAGKDIISKASEVLFCLSLIERFALFSQLAAHYAANEIAFKSSNLTSFRAFQRL